MKYISTRGETDPMPFSQAVMTGLARDGGLLLPESYPDVRANLDAWSTLKYQDLAFNVIRLFADDIEEDALRAMINKSYSVFSSPDVTPVREIGDFYLLELFHGPTLAFKDVALQFLGNLFEYLLGKSGGEMNIVAATSGDTGSAAIHGVKGRKHQRIFVMHPHGRVSRVQEMQMTSVTDSNVFNLSVDGTFDDCQAIVKTLFRDLNFRDECHLGAVNSINWARVLAQVVYYFYSALRIMCKTGAKKVRFSVPTGNFGDIFAGYVASRMGLPIDKLILATNENDILSRFFTSGDYSIGKVAATLSPSMDIQIASNFERYLYHRAGENPETVREWMNTFSTTKALKLEPDSNGTIDPLFAAGSGNTVETLATIREIYEKHGVVLDPHTAVGVTVGRRNKADDAPVICLATAHPAKFPDAIKRATGKDGLAIHPSVEALEGMPLRSTRIGADPVSVAQFIKERI